MLKILWKRGEIAPEEQFLILSTIFCYRMLDFYVNTGIRFSLRDKRLFEITEVEITRVDCIIIANTGKKNSVPAAYMLSLATSLTAVLFYNAGLEVTKKFCSNQRSLNYSCSKMLKWHFNISEQEK